MGKRILAVPTGEVRIRDRDDLMLERAVDEAHGIERRAERGDAILAARAACLSLILKRQMAQSGCTGHRADLADSFNA